MASTSAAAEFYSTFQTLKNSASLQNPLIPDVESALETAEAASKLSLLRSELAAARSSLPPYDQRSYDNVCIAYTLADFSKLEILRQSWLPSEERKSQSLPSNDRQRPHPRPRQPPSQHQHQHQLHLRHLLQQTPRHIPSRHDRIPA